MQITFVGNSQGNSAQKRRTSLPGREWHNSTTSSCPDSVCTTIQNARLVCGGTKLARYLARAVKSTSKERERERERHGAFYGIIETACVASHARSMLCRLLQRTRVTYLLRIKSVARAFLIQTVGVGECRAGESCDERFPPFRYREYAVFSHIPVLRLQHPVARREYATGNGQCR